jgi:hypothetical protein
MQLHAAAGHINFRACAGLKLVHGLIIERLRIFHLRFFRCNARFRLNHLEVGIAHDQRNHVERVVISELSSLLGIARSAIDAAVRGSVAPALPVNTSATAILAEVRGVFVTLTRSGRLRGCIGRVEPDLPLAALLPLMAVMSATRDPRFPAVAAEELDTLRIEISLLSTPTPLSNPAAIQIGRVCPPR